MSHLEVLGRGERRRRFTVEEKLAILAEASVPETNISAVARRYGLFPAQLYKWRRLAELGVIAIPGASELPSFVAVQIGEEGRSDPPPITGTAVETRGSCHPRRSGTIEIDLGDGRRIVVDSDVDSGALTRVIDVLGRR
jgi:transposase